MHNEGRLFSQVAAEAGVPTEKAMIACYLANLSKEGKTLNEGAALLRKERCEVRDYARDWGISFPDYAAAASPLSLIWHKKERGLWTLEHRGSVVAEAASDGDGAYKARYVGRASEAPAAATGSSAEIAMRRLSLAMERRCDDLFGTDDVAIKVKVEGSRALQIAPKPAEDPARLRKALAVA